MKPMLMMVCGIALLVFLLFQASASQSSGIRGNSDVTPASRYGARIYLDDGTMSLVSGYLCGSQGDLPFRNLTFQNSKLSDDEAFLNLPCYPFSQKLMSIRDGKSGVLVYETASGISQIKRYYFREMKRRGWNPCSEEKFHRGMSLFQNAESICFLHLERDSGVTNITVVLSGSD